MTHNPDTQLVNEIDTASEFAGISTADVGWIAKDRTRPLSEGKGGRAVIELGRRADAGDELAASYFDDELW